MKAIIIGILCCFTCTSFSQDIDELRVALDIRSPLLFELMQVDSQAISLCYSDRAEKTLIIQKIDINGNTLHKGIYKGKGEYHLYMGYIENESLIHVFFGDERKSDKRSNKRYHAYTLNKRTNNIKKTELSIDLKRRWKLLTNSNVTNNFFQIYTDDPKHQFEFLFIDEHLNMRTQSVNFSHLLKQAGIVIKRPKRNYFLRSKFNNPQDMSRLDWFHPIYSKDNSKYFSKENKVHLIFDQVIYKTKSDNLSRIGSVYITYHFDTNEFDVFERSHEHNQKTQSSQSFVFDDEIFNLSVSKKVASTDPSYNYHLFKIDPSNRQLDTLKNFSSTNFPRFFQEPMFTRFNPYFEWTNKNTKIWNLENITKRGVRKLTNANIRPFNNFYVNRKLFSMIETENGYDLLIGIMKNGRLLDNHTLLGELAYMRQYGIGATPYTSEYYYIIASLDKNFEFSKNTDGFYKTITDLYKTMDLSNKIKLDFIVLNKRIHLTYIDKSTKEFVVAPINY